MVDGEATIEGRRWRYSVSDNLDASTWALNVHGYMAGGGIYWRESARLAAKLGLRVINPNLPGFSGSDPLPWEDLRMTSFARGLAGLLPSTRTAHMRNTDLFAPRIDAPDKFVD